MSVAQRLSSLILDIVETSVVALSIFLVVYLFFMQPHQVNGQSMEPTFLTGEYVLTDKVSYQTGDPQRGDIIVFHAPESAGCPKGTGCDFIKRVLAVPGDTFTIENGKAYVNGIELPEPYLRPGTKTEGGKFAIEGRDIYLGENEYMAVGDNRPFSSDSRTWGPISKQEIVGRAFLRYWPASKVGLVQRAVYQGLSQ